MHAVKMKSGYVLLFYLFCYYKFLQKFFPIYCSFYYYLLLLLLLLLLILLFN